MVSFNENKEDRYNLTPKDFIEERTQMEEVIDYQVFSTKIKPD